MADWVRTQGDRVHSLLAQLTDLNGAIDIPPGTTVTFSGRLLGDETALIGGNGAVNRPGARPDDPNRGEVRYDLNSDDVSAVGIYYCKWKLTPPGFAFAQSFPEDSEMTLVILPSV